jgi:parallel beta-helix repeat protein
MNVIAEDLPEHPEFDWIVDASGNYFELTNSNYLNITMSSSEDVEVYLESYPKTVSFHIKKNCNADSTIITLSGFEANTIYYRYQDGNLQESFTTDATGSYSYTQDIIIRHHVYIEETTSTIYIYSSGSVSSPDINRDGNVYTFLNNISDSGGIRIYKSDIILDGNGYTLDGLSSTSYTYGIYFYNQHDITIKNLNITGYKNGIYCSSNSDNINISNNTFSNNAYNDIDCSYCSNVIMTDNVVTSSSNFGIQLYKCSGTFTIDNNIISNKPYYGIYSYSDTGSGPVFTITNNILQNNNNDGILLYYSGSGATIRDNTISNCGYGIYCLYGSNIVIIDNTVTSCGRGIASAGSGSNNIIIMKNIISSGEWGIYCSDTIDVNINKNSISSVNDRGIYLSYATSTIVTENTISDCNYGLYLRYSSGNTFHHNNIITNMYQVHRYYGNPVNIWDDGNGEGNYWSDYVGTDTNGDGVGDTNTPHPFTSHDYGYYQLDNYPLINQWTPINHPPIADAGGPYIDGEGFPITFDASGSYDSDWDNLQYRWDFDNDGVWDTSWLGSPKYSDTWGNDTSSTVVVEVSDDEFTSTATSSLTVNNVAPEVSIVGGGIGVADNYVFVTDFNSRSYYIEIDDANGVLSNNYEIVDDKDSRTSGAAVGDFDNDGDFDAIYGDGYNTWYYEKLGPGKDFASAVSIDYGTFNMRCDFAEADFNNDGNLDAIMAYYWGSNYYTIYLGTGYGTFNIMTLPSPTNYMWGMDAGDFNTDGKIDFVATSLYGGAYIHIGNGNGTFQSPIYIPTSGYNYAVCAGDFDNDGDDDLIMGYNPIMFYPGDGYGNFDTPVSLDFSAVNIAKTDINNDGILDIVYTDWSNLVYRAGVGDGTFTLISSLYFGGDIRGVATGTSSGGIFIDEGYLEEFIGEFFDFGWLDTHTAIWTWGDGSPTEVGTVTEENIEPLATGEVTGSHSYEDNGEYTVTLTVSDDDTSTYETSSVTVNNVPPTVNAGSDQNAFVGIPSSFSGSFSDPGLLDTHTIEWDWGDGLPVSSGTLTPQHTFIETGVFTVILNVTDNDGGVGIGTLTVTVYYPPIADAGIDQTVDEGDTINFDAAISTGSYRDLTITNPGFDTSDYNGWTVYIPPGGSANVVTTHIGGMETVYSPIDGSYFSLLKTDGPGSYTTVSQTFSINAGESISGWAAFDARDSGYWNDNACVQILQGDVVIATPWYSDVSIVGDFGDGPWEEWSWTATSSGSYDLEYRVANAGDSSVDSYALFDSTVYTGYIYNLMNSYEWDFDNDGIYDYQETTSNAPDGLFDGKTTHIYGDNNSYTVKLQVTDELGATDTDTCLITVNNVAPTITTLTSTVDPVQLGNPISANATFTDPGFLDTHTAIWDWDDGNTTTGTISGSGGTYTVNTESWTYGQPGVYTITLTVEDDDGGNDTMIFKYVVIYDPSAGFVTGGGWIMSPEGAYTPDPNLTGKANFGFVAKYKKGQSTPDGNTEFQFKVANLNFHSNDYEWLVIQIAGAKAMYKGTGTINGEGNYGFKITAIDEELTPSTDVDMFRIKIWDKDNNDEVIYDNQLGDEDNADPSTPINGGSIRIHKG